MAGTYEKTPRSDPKNISTANTSLTGSGTLTAILTGVTGGTKVRYVPWSAVTTSLRGWIAFFHDDGTDVVFLSLDNVGEQTFDPPNGSPEHGVWIPPGGELLLPSSSHILKACPYNAETFGLDPQGGDLV